MFQHNNPSIDYDNLEQAVAARLARLETLSSEEQHTRSDQEHTALFNIDTLEDLYALDNEDFIQAAYHTFLGRDADAEGFQHHLKLLESGVSRSAIAAGLRYSRPARSRPQRFHLRRAWLNWIVVRTPVIGRALEAALALLTIGNIKRTLLQVQRQLSDIPRLREGLMLAEHEQNRLRQDAIAHVEQSLAQTMKAWQRDFQSLKDENRELRQRLAASSNTGFTAPTDDDPVDEDFYLAFETHFRGPDSLIRERLAFYLPILEERLPRELKAAPSVDIGCGRGEWLSMLGGAGYRPFGIDLNNRNVTTCRERGLDAEQGDGIEWLRSQASDSVAMVTAFHVIEHLSLAALNTLLVETMRVLKPGGLLIVETPNPENLITAAHHFYTDPTHRHPLPPTLCEFLLAYRGFADIRSHRLHPVPEDQRLTDQTETGRLCDTLFNGPRDYAMVACKPQN